MTSLSYTDILVYWIAGQNPGWKRVRFFLLQRIAIDWIRGKQKFVKHKIQTKLRLSVPVHGILTHSEKKNYYFYPGFTKCSHTRIKVGLRYQKVLTVCPAVFLDMYYSQPHLLFFPSSQKMRKWLKIHSLQYLWMWQTYDQLSHTSTHVWTFVVLIIKY